MAMYYNVNYYNQQEIGHIKNVWKTLQNGKDMTYFQRYEWNEMLCSIYRILPSCLEIVFAVVEAESKPLMIAPLVISRSYRYKNYSKGAYLLGDEGWSDYCNLIYDIFDGNGFVFLCESLRHKYGIRRFKFHHIQEENDLYQYLLKSKRLSIKRDKAEKCVRLAIPDTREEYNALLSKHTKQNIRTAYNRAEKDGIHFTICHDCRDMDIKEFMRHKNIRAHIKDEKAKEGMRRPTVISRIKGLIWRVRKCYAAYHFPSYTPYENDSNSRFLTVKDKATGEMCASINYGYAAHRKEIYIMAVSLNARYYRYSPGIIGLYDYILRNIGTKEIKYLDFTRGDENYKYVMGGKDHINHHVIFLYNQM